VRWATEGAVSPAILSKKREGTAAYYLIHTLLVLAMLFFFFLPITDRRTARIKLWMVCAFAVALTVLATSFGQAPSASIEAWKGSPVAMQRTADDLAGSAVEIDTRKIDPVSIEGTTRNRAGWNAMNRGVIF
jgi:hypothetical protein